MSRFFADLKIGYFKDYLRLIKNTIDADFKKIEEEHQRLKVSGIKAITSEDGSGTWDPYDQLADEAFQIREMQQLMYRTHMIGILIFIEDEINNICKIIHRVDKLPFSYKDLKGMGISRSIKYLETVTGNSFPKDATAKKDFEMAVIIRNSLVHNDGRIEDRDLANVKTYITKNPKILFLSSSKEVGITYEYSNFLIELSEKINLELELYDKSPW